MSTLPLPGEDLASKSPRIHEFLLSQTEDGYTTISIPATYGHNTGLAPGAIAGIVLGSVAGLCILLYLLFISLLKVGFKPRGGGGGPITARSVTTRTFNEEVVTHSRRGSRSPRRRGSVVEVVEDRRSSSYRRPPSHDHVIVEESESGTATTDPRPDRNLIEVFEEDSSPSSASKPSRGSRRSHRSRTRIVEPPEYGSSHGSR